MAKKIITGQRQIVTTIKVGMNRSLKWCPKIIWPELCSTRKHSARVVFKFGTNVEEQNSCNLVFSFEFFHQKDFLFTCVMVRVVYEITNLRTIF